MEQGEECLGLALDPGALTSLDLPMPALQKAETENNPSSYSIISCQKHSPTRDVAIQQLPIMNTELTKAGSREKLVETKHLWGARLGNESLGTFLLPSSLIGNCFFF